jgi:hypothetical protein
MQERLAIEGLTPIVFVACSLNTSCLMACAYCFDAATYMHGTLAAGGQAVRVRGCANMAMWHWQEQRREEAGQCTPITKIMFNEIRIDSSSDISSRRL